MSTINLYIVNEITLNSYNSKHLVHIHLNEMILNK